MKLDIKKNAINGTIWGIISQTVTLVFPFITRTIIIRMLGSEYAGLSSLFTSILQVLSIAELGFGTAMVYAMYQPIAMDNKGQIRAILNFYRKVYLYIGLAILTLGICVLPFLRSLISGTVPSDTNVYILFIIYLINTVVSYFFFAYRSSVLSAYQRQDVISIVTLIFNVLMYLMQIIILLTTKNYYIYIVCLPICTILINYTNYRVSMRLYPELYPSGEVDINERKDIFVRIKALFLHKIGGIVLNSTDTIIISSFLGLIALSNYNNYYYLINAVSGLVMMVFASLTAGIGNSLIIDDIYLIRNRFYFIFHLNGIIVTVCTACFFSLYQDFISFWVGEENLLDYCAMILFCIYFFIHMIRRTVLMYRDASGEWQKNQWQPIASAIFNLTVNIMLVKKLNIYGILISSIMAQVLIDIPWESSLTTMAILKEKPLKYYGRTIIYLAATIISCVIIYLIPAFSSNNVVINLFWDLIKALFVTIIVCLTVSSLLPEGKGALKDFRHKMLKK